MKKLKLMGIILAAWFVFSPLTSTIALAGPNDNQQQNGSGALIPGMPTPNLGDGGSGTIGFKTEQTVGTFITKKGTALLGILSIAGTFVLIGLGYFKGIKLSGSSARDRSDAVKDILWWAVGTAVTFSIAVICGVLYFFVQPGTGV